MSSRRLFLRRGRFLSGRIATTQHSRTRKPRSPCMFGARNWKPARGRLVSFCLLPPQRSVLATTSSLRQPDSRSRMSSFAGPFTGLDPVRTTMVPAPCFSTHAVLEVLHPESSCGATTPRRQAHTQTDGDRISEARLTLPRLRRTLGCVRETQSVRRIPVSTARVPRMLLTLRRGVKGIPRRCVSGLTEHPRSFSADTFAISR